MDDAYNAFRPGGPCLKENQTMNNESSTTDFPPKWRDLWSEMQKEFMRLNQEVAQLRTERDQLSKAVFALLHEEVTLSDEEILAKIGREKPLRDLLSEMRAQLVAN
jgi:hypothetical protein